MLKNTMINSTKCAQQYTTSQTNALLHKNYVVFVGRLRSIKYDENLFVSCEDAVNIINTFKCG